MNSTIDLTVRMFGLSVFSLCFSLLPFVQIFARELFFIKKNKVSTKFLFPTLFHKFCVCVSLQWPATILVSCQPICHFSVTLINRTVPRFSKTYSRFFNHQGVTIRPFHGFDFNLAELKGRNQSKTLPCKVLFLIGIKSNSFFCHQNHFKLSGITT